MAVDRTNQTQTSLWLPTELLESLAIIAGNIGVSRRKLIWMILQDFDTQFTESQDPDTLYGKLVEEFSADYIKKMRDLAKELE